MGPEEKAASILQPSQLVINLIGKEGLINSNTVLLCEEIEEFEIIDSSINPHCSSYTSADPFQSQGTQMKYQ